MYSTHAQSAALDSVLAALEALLGHRPEPSDRVEADLALDSVDLAVVAAEVPFDLYGHLRTLDFDQLVELRVGELVP